ncbi:MAG TPA: VOC family protein [Candidatus Binatia bacterium]|nr:VOC family protein [Candidatus Binatia bacterium]
MAPSSVLALRGITITAVDVEAMVEFYNTLFDADLQPFEGFGTLLYRGQMAGFPLLMCPNEILGIEADKNRIQLSLTVSNLEEMLQKTVAYGGAQIQPITEEPGRKLCGIADPDGNTIELEELAPTTKQGPTA